MAIGWLALVKLLPLGLISSKAMDLISSKAIADGAKKLLSAVVKKPRIELSPTNVQVALSPEAQSIAILQAQLAAVEAEVSDLHSQMLESSKLIKDLAEQNDQLIKRFEVNRIRVLRLAGIMVVLMVVLGIVVAAINWP